MPNFVEIAQNAAEIWRFFIFSRWRPSAILDFQKLKISTSGPIRRPNMRHCTKFLEDRSNSCGDMADFRFYKKCGRRHLGFWKFQIFNSWDTQEGRTASACQILSKLLKTRLRYGDFSIFQDGGAAILDFENFKFLTVAGVKEGRTASSCQISSKSVKPQSKYGYF